MNSSFLAIIFVLFSIINFAYAQNCGAPIPADFINPRVLPTNVRVEQANLYCASVQAAVSRVNFLLIDKRFQVTGDMKNFLTNFTLPANTKITKNSANSLTPFGEIDYQVDSGLINDSFNFELSGAVTIGSVSVPGVISILVKFENRYDGEVIEELPEIPEHYDTLGRLVPATKGRERLKVKSQASVSTSIVITNGQTLGDIINIIWTRSKDEEDRMNDDRETILAKLDLIDERVKDIKQELPENEFEVIQVIK